jgi:hypothetical protein
MRRKRLNHAAETMCAMFCGWRLMNSYEELSSLGSGKLEIDALHLKASFNGLETEALSIAHELHIWLKNDLQANNIPSDALYEAKLAIELEITRVPATKSQRSFYIGGDGMPIRKGEFFKHIAQCKSTIKTDDAVYESERTHYEQWPVRWLDA